MSTEVHTSGVGEITFTDETTCPETRALARPPRTEEELAALEGLGASERLRRVRENGPELRLETLASLLRRALREDDHELSEVVAQHILVGIRPIVLSVAGWLEEADRDELRQDVFAIMWRDFLERADAPLLIWEQRFSMALWRKCVTAMKKHRRALKREAKLHERIKTEVEDGDVPALGDTVRPLDPQAIVVVLRHLTPKQAQAVTLAWLNGKQISGEGSVSEIMDISPSMVHRHLRLAELRIAELRENDEELRELLGL